MQIQSPENPIDMSLENRYACHPTDAISYDTDELREHFLLQRLMQPGEINGVHSHYDRMIILGIVPVKGTITLPAYEETTKQPFFLARREIGVINVGGPGKVSVDGQEFEVGNKECLYIGRGKKEVIFSSVTADIPAMFYANSCPAHADYPTTFAKQIQANRVELGSQENANKRTIFQFIHEGGIQSCQLVMGFTELSPGNVWNTFPPHTHDRRMEVYFYFDLPEGQRVCHLMGEPDETRHLFLSNNEGAISPSWSIHAGAGTAAYSFIWSMAGENKAFTDMDRHSLEDVR